MATSFTTPSSPLKMEYFPLQNPDFPSYPKYLYINSYLSFPLPPPDAPTPTRPTSPPISTPALAPSKPTSLVPSTVAGLATAPLPKSSPPDQPVFPYLLPIQPLRSSPNANSPPTVAESPHLCPIADLQKPLPPLFTQMTTLPPPLPSPALHTLARSLTAPAQICIRSNPPPISELAPHHISPTVIANLRNIPPFSTPASCCLAPAPPWCWLISGTEPNIRLFYERAIFSWIEEPPGNEPLDVARGGFSGTKSVFQSGEFITTILKSLMFDQTTSDSHLTHKNHFFTIGEQIPQNCALGSWIADFSGDASFELNFTYPGWCELWFQRGPNRFLSLICGDKHICLSTPGVKFHSSVSYNCIEFVSFLAQVCVIGECLVMVPYLCCICLKLIFYPICWWNSWYVNVDLSTWSCVFCNVRHYVTPFILHRLYADGVGRTVEHAQLMSFGGTLVAYYFDESIASPASPVLVEREWAGADTPNEGTAGLQLQRLSDTRHHILLIAVLGGVSVVVLHSLLEIISPGHGLDVLAAIIPIVKAVQAAVILGNGFSLGPEGPGVDIEKSNANEFSMMMENNRQRKNVLVAIGAATKIASAFNEVVIGCSFVIEKILRPLHAENSLPFTTPMIKLVFVVSSTILKAITGKKQVVTVPSYGLKSADELPLYPILGMLCGVVSVVFSHLMAWFKDTIQFVKERFGISNVVCPALAGFISLKYTRILEWEFANVDKQLITVVTCACRGGWSKGKNNILQLCALLTFLISPGRGHPSHLALGLEFFRRDMQAKDTQLVDYGGHLLLTLKVHIHPRSLPLLDLHSGANDYKARGHSDNTYPHGEPESKDDDLIENWIGKNDEMEIQATEKEHVALYVDKHRDRFPAKFTPDTVISSTEKEEVTTLSNCSSFHLQSTRLSHELQSNHHLEDKVDFEDAGNDTISDPDQQPKKKEVVGSTQVKREEITSLENPILSPITEASTEVSRPVRNKRMTARTRDYVSR